jgi:hypothetical protein
MSHINGTNSFLNAQYMTPINPKTINTGSDFQKLSTILKRDFPLSCLSVPCQKTPSINSSNRSDTIAYAGHIVGINTAGIRNHINKSLIFLVLKENLFFLYGTPDKLWFIK